MNPNKRERIRSKTDGHCAYCGVALPKCWHIDHVDPVWRNRPERGGNDGEDNLMPACARCNRWKGVLTTDQFRAEIQAQFDRLYRDVPGFRLAVDYGLIEQTRRRAIFYTER